MRPRHDRQLALTAPAKISMGTTNLDLARAQDGPRPARPDTAFPGVHRGETRTRHQAPLPDSGRKFFDLNKDPIVCPIPASRSPCPISKTPIPPR